MPIDNEDQIWEFLCIISSKKKQIAGKTDCENSFCRLFKPKYITDQDFREGPKSETMLDLSQSFTM